MSPTGLFQLIVLSVALGLTVPLVGAYLARVYGPADHVSPPPAAPGDRIFLPIERFIYRCCGVDDRSEQRWSGYAVSLLSFSAVSVVVLYTLLRVQGSLPLNPDDIGGVDAPIAFNTAVSFVTNTNWQAYSGEVTMSHLSQMAGLTVQNFVSAAVGLAVAVAIIRGIGRRGSATLGNFWVDLTRTVVRVLVPVAFVAALVMVSQGVIQNLSGGTEVTTLSGAAQVIPGGPVASQEAIKQLGTNGGGFFNAN